MKKTNFLKFFGIIFLLVLVLFFLNILVYDFLVFLEKRISLEINKVFVGTFIINSIFSGIFLKEAAKELYFSYLNKTLTLIIMFLISILAICAIASYIVILMFF